LSPARPHWHWPPAAQQPQQPVLQARTISNALTSIASSCGEAYRRREFTPGDDLRSLEASASSSARQLVAIASRHPAWIFQGKTLVELVDLSRQDLRACALSGAAALLPRHTATS